MRLCLGCILILELIAGCVTDANTNLIKSSENFSCGELVGKIDWDNEIATLNTISELYTKGCYRQTIDAGTKARDEFRYKKYSILKDSAELFLPEGTVTDYILESYERGYLTFLITASFLRLNDTSEAIPELNRYYNEEVASIYNYGRDPVNVLLQAVLWDNIPRQSYSSRPFWLWLAKDKSVPKPLQEFAVKRISDLDSKQKQVPWQLSAVGKFPEANWSMNFVDGTAGYFKIRSEHPFPQLCIVFGINILG